MAAAVRRINEGAAGLQRIADERGRRARTTTVLPAADRRRGLAVETTKHVASIERGVRVGHNATNQTGREGGEGGGARTVLRGLKTLIPT